MSNVSKIVVIDLDETLGYFIEFGIFWIGLHKYFLQLKTKLVMDQTYFNALIELYPEFFRPNILKILNYLKGKKEAKKCNKVIIYTNNQGPKSWAQFIKTYFEMKIDYKLFDQIIGAFKINGQRVEKCRTSSSKSYSDFMRCSKNPKNTHICFLDDTFYPEMNHSDVYYIHVKPYISSLTDDIMIHRFLNNVIFTKNIPNPLEFKEFMKKFMSNYIYPLNFKTKKELSIDKILSTKILEHLENFFSA